MHHKSPSRNEADKVNYHPQFCSNILFDMQEWRLGELVNSENCTTWVLMSKGTWPWPRWIVVSCQVNVAMRLDSPSMLLVAHLLWCLYIKADGSWVAIADVNVLEGLVLDTGITH